MTHRSLTRFASLFVLAALGAGCGGNCKSNCEDSAKCDGSALADVDCDEYCKKVENLNEAAGCDDQFDKLLRCASDQDDVCKGDACSAEAKNYGDCTANYCRKSDDNLKKCAEIYD